MDSNKRLRAAVLSALLVLSVIGSGIAFAGMAAATTTADGNETVDDGNETVDDGNETVDDGNETVDDRPFGQMVSEFVQALLAGSGNETNGTDATIGQQVAAFVTQNNPGNAPDHAGPGNETGRPDHAGPGNETGQPDHAGPGNETGRPDSAGQPDETGPSSSGDHRGEEGFPGDQGTGDDQDQSTDRGNGGNGGGDGGPPR